MGVTEWYTKYLKGIDSMYEYNMTYEEAKEWCKKGWCPVWHSDTRCLMDSNVVKTCDECIEREYGKAKPAERQGLRNKQHTVHVEENKQAFGKSGLVLPPTSVPSAETLISVDKSTNSYRHTKQ